jgi:gamma-glutamylcyclotransferase (GGCT)/AIG2-like uncharacterized protein YtfP
MEQTSGNADAKARRHVFVYGTLRRGGSNDITRLTPAPTWIGEAEIAGTLYDFGRYPGAVLGGSGRVAGEVYAVDAALERILDEIEEVYPQQTDEYVKREVLVHVAQGPLQCLVYEMNPRYVGAQAVIEQGDWMAYLSMR